MIFVHQGAYEGGTFKFRIDFPMRYPMNQLPSVKFMAKQVYSPLVHLDTGALDISKLFAVEDSDYSDQNYINGCLVNCFEGFCK